MQKTWQVSPKAPDEFLQSFPALPQVFLQLLWNRGLTSKKQIESFFAPTFERDCYDPFLLGDMDKAVARIQRALDAEERITIFSDYDVDGVTGGIILWEALKLCDAHVAIYIPDRNQEGHGTSKKAVSEIAEQGVTLLITVDCGINDVEEVAFAKSLGMDVIISDHHLVGDTVPDAYAVVNAKKQNDTYPYKWLCGAACAWKIADALLQRTNITADKSGERPSARWLDILALATIADMVPLTDENRVITKLGLVALRETGRLGLRALMKISGIASPDRIDERQAAMTIVPRLNSVSRIDHANSAFRLLAATSEDEAETMAKLLDKKNTERQQIVERITKEMRARMESGDAESMPLVIASHTDAEWPLGVLGLVASKMVEEYAKPTFLFSCDANGLCRGSARSVKGFNLVEAMQGIGADVLVQFGGHAQAAGATVQQKNLGIFEDRMRAIMNEWSVDRIANDVLMIDAELRPQEISERLAEELQKFAPFGQENPMPRFLVKNLEMVSMREVGNGSAHLQCELLGRGPLHGMRLRAIAFGRARSMPRVRLGDTLDVVCEILYDEWRGRRELKLKIIDAQKSTLSHETTI